MRNNKGLATSTIILLTTIIVCIIMIIAIIIYPIVYTKTYMYSLTLYNDNGSINSEFDNCLGITRLNSENQIIVYLDNGESFKTGLDYKLTPNSIK